MGLYFYFKILLHKDCFAIFIILFMRDNDYCGFDECQNDYDSFVFFVTPFVFS